MAPPRKYHRWPREVGVYGILNTVTGRWYIGSSAALSKRMGRHLWELRAGRHHSQKLQRSFNKHGEQAFQFKVLVFCSEQNVEMFEPHAIQVFESATKGYNVAHEPRGGFMRGRTWPETTKAARIAGLKGRTHSDVTRATISERKRAQWADPEIRDRMTQSQRVQKSPEGAANIAAASARRLHDPALAEARRQATLRAWETRRSRVAKEESIG